MEQYPHINAAVARIAKRKPGRIQRLFNAFGNKPDPYMAWKDDSSLLTQDRKKKKGVIKVSNIATEKEKSISRTNANKNEAGLKKLKALYLSRRGGKFPTRQLSKGAY